MVKTVSGFMYTMLEANQFKDSDWDQDIKKKKKNVEVQVNVLRTLDCVVRPYKKHVDGTRLANDFSHFAKLG